MSLTAVALVDAFTRTPGQGNRAGVVVDAHDLDESKMQAIAKAIGASETAFVRSAPGDAPNFEVRYFTPETEVSFCGHATVATAHHLVELGRMGAARQCVVVCPAGRIELELERIDDACRIWLTTPQYPWSPSPVNGRTLMQLLSGTEDMLDEALPVLRAGSMLFVPMRRRIDLWSLAPFWERLDVAGRAEKLAGFFVFTRDVLEPGNVAHGRFFAPTLGIREDPATGAANGPLAMYLARQGVIRLPNSTGNVRVRAEQGDAMGKPGRIDLELIGTQGNVERVRVGGFAVTVLEGRVRTPVAG